MNRHPGDHVVHDYVDEALGPDEHVEVRRHLDTCASCRNLAHDLVELKRITSALGPMEPPARVWSRLQHAAGQPAPRSAPWYWLGAAAAVAVAAIVGVTLRRAPQEQARTANPVSTVEAAQSVEAELRQAEEHYEKAIKGLEQIANDQKGELDARTADTLQKNLAVIDQAISESREAVRTQPNSEPAEESLLDNFKTKVSVLQDTVALINEMRKGNETGAARIVSGLSQKGS